MEPMGIERHRWASREAEVSRSERVNTTLSGSGRIDDIQSHPQGELCGETKFVKITEDVRKNAAEQGIKETEAAESGVKAKAKEFAEQGAEVRDSSA
jgi:hypothetical protein